MKIIDIDIMINVIIMQKGKIINLFDRMVVLKLYRLWSNHRKKNGVNTDWYKNWLNCFYFDFDKL